MVAQGTVDALETDRNRPITLGTRRPNSVTNRLSSILNE